jgi:uncharacterized protein YecE (DUF72 family)
MRVEESAALLEFRFREVHADVFIGTASDRYAGWIGQIYSKGKYEKGITRRSHKVGDKTFTEEILPVESVVEYLEHFPVLEIDYTFYRPLLDPAGKPTPNYHTLRQYRQYLKEGDQLVLKVPQVICARRIRQKGGFVANEDYLNPEIFKKQFYEPAVEILGPFLGGLIFEQEYHPKNDRMETGPLADSLNSFFQAIPEDNRYQVELRTEAYLGKPVYDVLEKRGVGLVYSHWTWLPPLSKQFSKAEGRFFNSGRRGIIRLMTPLRMSYEDSYVKAFPFDKMIEGMLNPAMVKDTVQLIREGIAQGIRMIVIINNRAGGNAPLIAQEIVAGLHLEKSQRPF